METQIKLSKKVKENLRKSSFNAQMFHNMSKRTNKEIFEDYEIVQQIGKGLFSKVYLVKRSKKLFALKIVKKKNFTSPSVLKKFITEKEILQNTKNQNILKLFRTMQSNDRIYYELEYAEKGNLLEHLNNGMVFSLEDVQVISAQIITALLYLHQKNVIYGDLKAENILIDGRGVIKLCDFNLSGTSSFLGKTIQGTMAYLAPEILEKNHMDFEADFWALGVLIFLLYYRKYPFQQKNRSETIFNIIHRIMDPSFQQEGNSEIRKFILDLLQVEPNKRLGKNLKQFQNHIFFKDFNWKRIKSKNAFFSYVNKMNLERFNSSNVSSFNHDSNINFQGDANDQFIYNIDDFSFVEKSKESFLTNSLFVLINIMFSTVSFQEGKNYIQSYKFVKIVKNQFSDV